MKRCRKLIASMLVLTTIWLFLPNAAFCADAKTNKKIKKNKITQHQPEVKAEPEKDIALMKVSDPTKKKPNWLWIGIGGAVVLGLLAAVIGASGSGSGGEPKPQPEDDEGTITVGW